MSSIFEGNASTDAGKINIALYPNESALKEIFNHPSQFLIKSTFLDQNVFLLWMTNKNRSDSGENLLIYIHIGM